MNVPNLFGRLGVADLCLRRDGISDLVSNPHTSGPRAKDDHADIG